MAPRETTAVSQVHRQVWVGWQKSMNTQKRGNLLFFTAPPPGVAAPGMGVPPGMQQQEAHQPTRPGSFPSNFQPPVNMPNINFSAPVIRLGTSGPSKLDNAGGRDDRERGGRRPGLGSGMGSDFRGGERERITQVQPQTKEEIIKTVFVGGITEGTGGDEGIERILRAAGGLRRWVRATDADDKPCKFGFAEYEDPESLSTAIEVLRDVEVPVKRQTPKEVKTDEDTAVEMSKLVVCIGYCLCSKITNINLDRGRRQLYQLYRTVGGLSRWKRPQSGTDAT